MKIALREARKGIGYTTPNPRVGAVLVANDKVLATGYHHAYGKPHAEVECLSKISPDASKGSTLYVNLEPCCHHGKTPPCTDSIVHAGIKTVAYGMPDPNPQVQGKGLRELHRSGIEIIGPVLENEASEINRGYLKYRRTGKPWVTVKMAQSLDGRIAASNGDARWISGEESLKLAHQLRAQHDVILVGINTVLADDPQLTVRLVKGPDPRRLILDSSLRITPQAKVFNSSPSPVLIATKPYPDDQKVKHLPNKKAELIWIPPDNSGTLDLEVLLDELGHRGIQYLLVEGGGSIFSSFIKAKLFDEIIAVIAPKIIGGDGIPCMTSLGVKRVAQALHLKVAKRKQYGEDTAIYFRSG
jgi:diaminohydroxyphosphoribosylaminopyrimidine deaminase / 5-amino-6-(5-phosphoribosylamino)uracil reductase